MFEERKLSNGIRLAAEEMKYMNSIAFGVYVGCGSRYENENNNGIAHYIEHMLFKGTYRRSAADIACEMDELGGQLNAFTAKEYTCFYFKVLSEHFEKALDILADMLVSSRFDEKDIERERTVIDEEISVYEDTPEDLVFDRLQYEVWGRKNLGLEILGTHESIRRFDRKFFIDHMSKNYRTDNIVIAAAGNFDTDKLTEQLERAFSAFKPISYRNTFTKAVYTPKKVETIKDIEQLHLCFAFPSIELSDKSYTLSVLNTVCGGGMSSRLFQKIREELGLCYSVYSTYSSYMDTGIFMIYCGLNPKNLPQVADVCQKELEKLKKEEISPRELQRIKDQIKSSFLIQDEGTSARCSKLGRNTLLRGFCRSNKETLELIENINPSEVRELAENIFDFEKMSVSLVGKEGSFRI